MTTTPNDDRADVDDVTVEQSTTETEETEQAEATDDGHLSWMAYIDADRELTHLVRLVQRAGGDASLPITLTLSGQVVQGELISSGNYYRRAARTIEAALQRGERFNEMLLAVRDDLLEQADYGEEEAGRELQQVDEPKHLHMRNVVISAGGTQTHLDEWRARLGAVTGWSLATAPQS